jgi:hypothetical protein
MSYRAVLFDIGGVVFDSPFVAIYRYEEQLGLPKHTINKVRIDRVMNFHNLSMSSYRAAFHLYGILMMRLIFWMTQLFFGTKFWGGISKANG